MDSSDLDGISHKYFSVDHGSVMLMIITRSPALRSAPAPFRKPAESAALIVEQYIRVKTR
jgi:hypothetical protein